MNQDCAPAAHAQTGAGRFSLLRRDQGVEYLLGAICIGICAIMLAPLVVSISASLKTTQEASAIPPTYFTYQLSLGNYPRLWHYQAGLPTYLTNSGGTALLTIAFCLLLTVPAGYALARFPVPGKEFVFIFLLLALIVPYQSLLTPIFFMFAQFHLTNTLLGLAIVHTRIRIPFSVYVMRNSFEAVPREIEEAAVIDGASSWQVLIQICLPAISISDRHHRALCLYHRIGNDLPIVEVPTNETASGTPCPILRNASATPRAI